MKLSRFKVLCLTQSALMVLAVRASTDPIPPIGKIDFYGLKRTSANEVRRQLDLREGDSTPAADRVTGIERRLEAIPGVRKAKVSIICCEEGKSTVFVGIEEEAGAKFLYNPPPNGSASLPNELVLTYNVFLTTLAREVQAGNAREDDSQGHALFSAKALQPFQGRFISYADAQTDALKAALRNSRDSKIRAIAAWVLGYARDKRTVLDDLVHAVNDPDETVRNNATRTIGAIAALARAKPELGIRIEPDVFIRMLNSLSWSDRNKATMVLLNLSDQTPGVLTKLPEQTLSSLIEMARWKDGHSLMALQLVGKIAGASQQETEAAWREERREEIISKAVEQWGKAGMGASQSR